MSNSELTYYRYWGKSKSPLEVDYCASILSDDEIAEKHGITKEELCEKARKNGWEKVAKRKAYAACHLLPYHCLDVAAVAQVLLTRNDYWTKKLESLFGASEEKLTPWLLFFLAIHDLGKFAEAFQQLNLRLREKWWGEVQKNNYDVRHDTLGFLLWSDEYSGLEKEYEENPGLFDKDSFSALCDPLKPWVQAVTGHHGLPPRSPCVTRMVSAFFRGHDVAAARLFIDDLGKLFEPDISNFLTLRQDRHWRKQQKQASWLLAGFAIACDWLGSDASVFKYCDQQLTLDEYWRDYALPGAQEVVTKSGILPAAGASGKSFTKLFPKIKTPSPLQTYCAKATLPNSPQLFILEDVTGSGKTEAAITLVHRLMAQGLAQGMFVALPTMATANAMYERMASIYRALYGDDQRPSLVLSHSARHLSEVLQLSLWQTGTMDARYGNREDTATVQCARWLADNRKKALLADVGVGTVDQALLGILPAKHQSLRLFGLAGKVLLVDEVHAYDHYMFPLLRTLLKFHARFGGSAVLLSATLPQSMRRDLINAWRDGRGENPASQRSTAYPLMTHISDGQSPVEVHVASRRELARRVDVRLVHAESEVFETLKAAVHRGQCVCWIRNTVHDAREAYMKLKGEHWLDEEHLLLFHSRFVLADRLAIEEKVLELFGEKSNGKKRRGRVLISTQVVEQSLDLDFDVLISDLAPIDLLIQRAGRMHRHVRYASGDRNRVSRAEDQRAAPIFHVFSPPVENEPRQDWYKSLFPRANHVYSHTGLLWRSVRLLQARGGWAMPDDARELIEGVYGEEAEIIPGALEDASKEAIGEWKAQSGLAHMNALKLKPGYTLDENAWDDDAKIPTRLAEDSVTVYLVRMANGELKPLRDNGRYPWDLSSANLPIRKIQGITEDNAFYKVVEQLKREEKLFNDSSAIIPLEPDGTGRWKGVVVDGNGRNADLIYDAGQGVLVGGEAQGVIQEKEL